MDKREESKQVEFNNFINKTSIGKLNIWTLGYIPNNKRPGDVYNKGEYHWGDYYDYLKNEIEKSYKKPDLIILDKNSFYSFMQDVLENNLNIKTKAI